MNAERATPLTGFLSSRLRRFAGVAILCWLLPSGGNELPAADGPVTFDLKGRAEQMVVGGKGRYLVVSIPSERSAVVVDVADGSLKHTIELPSSRCSVAANRSELIVADLGSARATRYKLEDGSKIGPTVIFPSKVGWIGMGAASRGPLWAHEDYYGDSKPLEKLSILDARTLRKVKHIELPDHSRPKLTARNRSTSAITSFVVSDDGTTFTDTHRVVQIRGKKPTIIWQSGGVPSFDGNMLLETLPPFPTTKLPPAIPTSDNQLLPGLWYHAVCNGPVERTRLVGDRP